MAAGADAMFEMEDDVGLAPLPETAHDRVGMDGTGGRSESISSGESSISTSASGSHMMDQEVGMDGAGGGGRGQVGVLGGRRMSGVSEEERETARIYREGIMNKGGGEALNLPLSLSLSLSPFSFSTNILDQGQHHTDV